MFFFDTKVCFPSVAFSINLEFHRRQCASSPFPIIISIHQLHFDRLFRSIQAHDYLKCLQSACYSHILAHILFLFIYLFISIFWFLVIILYVCVCVCACMNELYDVCIRGRKNGFFSSKYKILTDDLFAMKSALPCGLHKFNPIGYIQFNAIIKMNR